MLQSMGLQRVDMTELNHTKQQDSLKKENTCHFEQHKLVVTH